MLNSYQFHYEVPQTLPPAKDVQLSQDKQQANQQEAGSKAYEDSMKAYQKKTSGELMDAKLTDEQYYKQLRKEEKEQADALKKLLEKDKDLSELQKGEIKSFLKYNDYKENYAKISHDYHANKNDPEAKAKYEEMQKEFKTFREVVENSPQYKDNQHIKNSKELSKQLDNAKTDDEKAAIRGKIAHEYREFARDNARDKDAGAKFVEFAEQNKDNVFIQKSGMYDIAQDTKKRLGLDKSKTEDKKEELGNMKVTPAGVVQAGAANGEDKNLAATQVAAANDNGIPKRDRFESREHNPADLAVPTQVSGQGQNSKATAAHL